MDPEDDLAEEIDGEIDAAILEALAEPRDAVLFGDAVHGDFSAVGPLARYIVAKRAKALTAFRKFSSLDIEQKAELRDCQDAVRAYFDVMIWVREMLTDAERAEQIIEREIHPQEASE